MCLVFAWYTGFFINAMTLLLSQNSIGTRLGMPMSQANLESHTSSVHAALVVTYFAYVIDRIIYSLSRDLQDMAPPIN